MLGEIVGLNPNKLGLVRRKPANLVRKIEELTDLELTTSPREERLSYWVLKTAGIRGNGWSMETIDQVLGFSAPELKNMYLNLVAQGMNRTLAILAGVGFRSANAIDAAEIVSNGNKLTPNFEFLIPAVTTKRGFHLFTNAELAIVEWAVGEKSSSSFRDEVNRLNYSLYLHDIPYRDWYEGLHNVLQDGVLTKNKINIILT